MRCVGCGRFRARDKACLKCKEDAAWAVFIQDNPLDQMFYEDEVVSA